MKTVDELLGSLTELELSPESGCTSATCLDVLEGEISGAVNRLQELVEQVGDATQAGEIEMALEAVAHFVSVGNDLGPALFHYLHHSKSDDYRGLIVDLATWASARRTA